MLADGSEPVTWARVVVLPHSIGWQRCQAQADEPGVDLAALGIHVRVPGRLVAVLHAVVGHVPTTWMTVQNAGTGAHGSEPSGHSDTTHSRSCASVTSSGTSSTAERG